MILKKTKSLAPLKTSKQLEFDLVTHFNTIQALRVKIQDLTVLERNTLKDERDALLISLNRVDNEIEELRQRSERVYVQVKEALEERKEKENASS